MVEQVILGMLMQGKMSGYDIKKTTEQTVGLYFTISYGSLYPALKRLVEGGMVTEEETNNSKNKKLYELTEAGRQSFLSWLREPLQSNRREYLVKIFFYDYLEQDTRVRNLGLFMHEQTAVLSRIEAVERIVGQELTQIPNKDDYYYRMSVMHYGLQFYRMELEWLKQLIEKREF
ncbi:PadR family transcriptional regulator [Paenibacillus sp. 1011MAR3C5]|uniref:PadR family transcriptional regulator n=1 Tax=Paenibacillus sp. 1011MAR3C5 TaxID=1675787 RepID=UPI000E6C398A|nr:PadR family transcriptional regulator [Paenibacillus sp. 1011MAR3C5]RJE88502.1 PadR family transcriptional regulator [Paenibacillus sp. 1011MAR3C5]